jgi:octaprenyl-diphosphate synthase
MKAVPGEPSKVTEPTMTQSQVTSDTGLNSPAIGFDLSHLEPKKLIDEALLPVSELLKDLTPHLKTLLKANTASSKHIVDHVFSGSGKRIRPALYFFSSRLVDYTGVHLMPIAAVCEYVHTASLLHDDVIDNSTLRRGKPTPNSIWGDESAVLVGDLIYSRASELMAETGSLEIVSMFAKAIRLMSDGELLQLEHLYNPMMPEDAYYKIIEHKTAVLLSAACRASAVLGNSPLEARDALSEFGRCVGYAFQLLDDALDYAGSETMFGKKTLSDLPEGKVTLPIIMLKKIASPEEWAYVESLIHSEEITADSMLNVLELVNRYDTAGKTLEEASKWTDRALEALRHFPQSAARKDMETLAHRLLMRFS